MPAPFSRTVALVRLILELKKNVRAFDRGQKTFNLQLGPLEVVFLRFGARP
jgi:hypothetical protein